MGIAACCKQTTPGSGNRESAGLALCRDSYIQLFQVLITAGAAAPPRRASWGCTSTFPRARWAAPTQSIKVCGTSRECLEHHQPARLEWEWGRDLLSSPTGAAIRLCPSSPGSEAHSSHWRKLWTNIPSRETMGRWGTREDEQQLLCCADFTTASPSHLTVPRRTQVGGHKDCAGTRTVMNGVLSATKPGVSSAAPGTPQGATVPVAAWRGHPRASASSTSHGGKH